MIIQVESERVNVVTLIFAHHPCGNVFQKHDDSQAIFYGCTPYISRTLNIVSNAQAQSTAIGYQISSGSSWSSLDPPRRPIRKVWMLGYPSGPSSSGKSPNPDGVMPFSDTKCQRLLKADAISADGKGDSAGSQATGSWRTEPSCATPICTNRLSNS